MACGTYRKRSPGEDRQTCQSSLPGHSQEPKSRSYLLAPERRARMEGQGHCARPVTAAPEREARCSVHHHPLKGHDPEKRKELRCPFSPGAPTAPLPPEGPYGHARSAHPKGPQRLWQTEGLPPRTQSPNLFLSSPRARGRKKTHVASYYSLCGGTLPSATENKLLT